VGRKIKARDLMDRVGMPVFLNSRESVTDMTAAVAGADRSDIPSWS